MPQGGNARICHLCSKTALISFPWIVAAMGAMRSLKVIECDIFGNSTPKFSGRMVFVDVDIFALETAKKALDDHIIDPSGSAPDHRSDTILC